jgi:hypothetical protein
MQKHPFHLVDPSPWPIFTSLAAFTTTFGGVMYMHGFVGGDFALMLGLIMIIYSMFVWWRDVIREATFEGHHTQSRLDTKCMMSFKGSFANYVTPPNKHRIDYHYKTQH